MLHSALVEMPQAEASSFCVMPFCFLIVLMAVPMSMVIQLNLVYVLQCQLCEGVSL